LDDNQLDNAIATARFSRYVTACNGHRQKGLELYRANIILSQRMYAVIGIFEVILRNSIDIHFTADMGPEWLANAVQPNGYLDIEGCENSFHSVQDALQSLAENYNEGRLVAKLSFGFWTYQFAPKEFAASGSSLLQIFPNRPFKTRQKDIFQNLTKINQFRNRIAHYEPICFDKHIISCGSVARRHSLIKEIITWLGYDPDKMLEGVDDVVQSIQDIEALKGH
jgi:hypothetical protein